MVTADALHTQRSTTAAFTGQGHDCVLTVKGNEPRLRAALEALPWRDVPSSSRTSTGHGRRMTRTIKTCQAPTWIDWPDAAQVAQLRRTHTTNGCKTVEVVYLITSLDARQARATDLTHLVQGHWGIENRLHWVRDVAFDEDRHQLRTGHGPAVMAALRSTAISLHRLAGAISIAQALRHAARDPLRPLHLITQPWQNPKSTRRMKDFAEALSDGRGRPPRFCSTSCRMCFTYVKKQLLQTWRMLEDARCMRGCGERVHEIMRQQAQCRWLLERYQVFDPAGDNERHESQEARQRLQEPTPPQDWLAAAQALIRLRPEA